MSQNQPYSLQSLIMFINSNFVVILLVVLGFAGGFFAGSVWTENQLLKNGGGAAPPIGADPTNAGVGDLGPTADQLATLPEVSEDDHIRGNRNAKVVLVEYSDFECPFCARFHPTMEQVREEYGNDVAWVYRHYPLSFHPQAQPSAEVSECLAQEYGEDAFWAYADRIFEINTQKGALTSADVFDTVSELGYDQGRIEECVSNGETTEIVNAQFSEGSAAGVSGTPGTIIITADGPQELIPGALPFDQVKLLIDKYL